MRQFERPTLAHALPAKLYRRAKEFWRARQAIAATEFALVLPLLIMLMLGSVEVARVIIAARNVTAVATTASEMLSQGTRPVQYGDLHFASESTMVIFPQILQDAAQKGISWKNDIAISIAGVCFSPLGSTDLAMHVELRRECRLEQRSQQADMRGSSHLGSRYGGAKQDDTSRRCLPGRRCFVGGVAPRRRYRL